MDGYALCMECRANDLLKSIPFIFYTATYTDAKDEAFALNLGAQKFLIKPQESSVLIKIIQEVLENSRTVKQSADKPLGEEMEFFRKYNEILQKTGKENSGPGGNKSAFADAGRRVAGQ